MIISLIMLTYTYEKIRDIFNEQHCQLLTTKDMFIAEQMNATHSMFDIISSCGHVRNNCRFKSFNSVGTGILCNDCTNNEKLNKLKNVDANKIERVSIEIFKKHVENTFDIQVMNESTKADIGIKYKDSHSNLFFPIQLKCTTKPKKTVFRFTMMNKIYCNMLVICISLEPIKFWIFNGNDNAIHNIDKITIGVNSKYNKYEVALNKVEEVLTKFILKYPQYYKPLEILNTPLSSSTQVEKDYSTFREESLPNILFQRANNNSVVDFYINSYKIQEKVGRFDNNSTSSIRFNMIKTSRQIKVPYNIEDNDFYWLHFPNKTQFLLLPAKILHDNGFLASGNDIISERKVSLQFCLNNILPWLKEYVYEYKPDTEKLLIELFDNLEKKELEKEIIDITTMLENNHIATQAYLDSKCKAKVISCIDCNAVLNKYNAKRCVDCSSKKQIIDSRDINGRPSYLTLIEELKTKTYRELAEKYGVSRPCVFNWVKKYEKHNLIDV